MTYHVHIIIYKYKQIVHTAIMLPRASKLAHTWAMLSGVWFIGADEKLPIRINTGGSSTLLKPSRISLNFSMTAGCCCVCNVVHVVLVLGFIHEYLHDLSGHSNIRQAVCIAKMFVWREQSEAVVYCSTCM
jgi:hypothetical protein